MPPGCLGGFDHEALSETRATMFGVGRAAYNFANYFERARLGQSVGSLHRQIRGDDFARYFASPRFLATPREIWWGKENLGHQGGFGLASGRRQSRYNSPICEQKWRNSKNKSTTTDKINRSGIGIGEFGSHEPENS